MASAEIMLLTKRLRRELSSFDADNEQLRQKLLQSARALVAKLETPAERIARMVYLDPGIYATTHVLVDLKIFKYLTNSTSPRSAEQLADLTGTDVKLLERLLKHVAADGLVQETSADEYDANDFTRFIASAEGEGVVKDMFQPFKVDASLPTYFKENGYVNPSNKDHSPWQVLTGKHYFDYVFEPGHEELVEAFHNHMRFKTLGPKWHEVPEIMDAVFGAEKLGREDVLLIDVGGSTGHDVLGFHKTHPDVLGRLILQDLPATIESLDAEAMAAQGVEAMVHDFFTSQPVQGAKVYYLKMVLHDWPNEQCKQILSHLKAAVKPGYSKILLNEIVIPDVGAGWFETSVDILMMKVHAAQERREREWRALIGSVNGLNVRRIWDVEGAVEKVIEIDVV